MDDKQNITPKPRLKLIVGVVLGFIILLIIVYIGFKYLSLNQQADKKTAPVTKSTEQNPSQSPMAVSEFKEAFFATYAEQPSNITPSIPSYTLKTSEILNLGAVASDENIKFTGSQLETLVNRGFFILPIKPKPADPDKEIYMQGNRFDDMIDLYSKIGGSGSILKRKPENAVFITSDFLIHIYHVLIDRTFQKIESDKLQPILKDLTSSLLKATLDEYGRINDDNLKESLKRVSAFYLVPLAILNSGTSVSPNYFTGPQDQEKGLTNDKENDTKEKIMEQLTLIGKTIPEEVVSLAKDELNLVLNAQGMSLSPLYSKLKPESLDDYSQYKPRSHYTKNSLLRTYFRAMMWFGRHGFDLKNKNLTLDSLIMTQQLNSVTSNGQKAAKLWESIYMPTVFFVGRSDDLTVYDYSSLMKEIYGDKIELSTLANTDKLDKFREKALYLKGPKILSDILVFDPKKAPTKEELLNSTKGFRFFGQRFIPDSYIFSTLTQGDEKPDEDIGQRLPSTPTALMVMSILGSNTADKILDGWIKDNAPDSDKVIAKVKGKLQEEFGKFDQRTWTQNIYWSWLYNLLPLFEDHGEGYPMFMKGLAWAKKSLNTALGSWTELRHDTLLYAKQSYAELGGGGLDEKPPPVPKGYVEPNLKFLTRLIALNKMTMEGLDNSKLLLPAQKDKFDEFDKSLIFFKTIAEKELLQTEITENEYEKLRTVVRFNFPRIIWSLEGDIMTERDARVGIIADVHTDAKKQQILYEAIGYPAVIFIAVKDKGGTRLTRGAVYAYYEFTNPLTNRLTDEDWQAMIYDGKNENQMPQKPKWADELVRD